MSDTEAKALRPTPPALRQSQPITKVKTLQELWDHPGLKSRMEAILPKHLNAERLLRTLINCGLKTPGLAKVDPMSMLGVAMTLAYLGLEPNTPLQQIHLIPFEVNRWNPASRKREYIRTDANLIIGYQGYVELIARGERVKDIDCQVIWEGDTLEYEHGSDRHFKHVERFAPRRPNQEPDFAYMHARLMTGGETIELMTAADIHHVRNSSQGYQAAMRAHDRAVEEGKPPARNPAYADAPWIKYPIPMWKKSALRSGQKWLPKSAELATAISLDEAGDEGRVRFDQVIEGEAVSEGVWEVASSDVELEAPTETVPTNRPTQVQVKTPDPEVSPATPQPDPKKTPSRQPAAKKAAAPPSPPDDEVPFGRWDEEQQQQQTSLPETKQEVTNPPTGAVTGQTSAATQEGESPSPATDVAFDAWLVDMSGEPVEPFTDPVAYADSLMVMLRTYPEAEAAIYEQNLDGIQDARTASPEAASMLQFAYEAVLDGAEPEAPGIIVVPLTFDRGGKPELKAYHTAFKKEVGELVAGNFLDFIEMNRMEMGKVPTSTISLCLKELVSKGQALGVATPPGLGASLLQKTTQAPATAAEPSDPDVPKFLTPAASVEDPDWKAARDRAKEIRDCKDLHEVNAMSNGIIIQSFGARMQREDKKEILDFITKTFADKRAELKATTGQA